MTIEEKANRIIEDVRNEEGVNPIKMFKSMAKKEYISIIIYVLAHIYVYIV